MKRIASLLAFVALGALTAIPCGLAQSAPQSSDSGTSSTQQKKAKRVWDNEGLQSLDGGISVVGNSRPTSQAGARPDPQDAKAKPRTPGTPAPKFSGTTMDGQSFSSASLRGRPVLLQFWATWCPRCRQDQPAVDMITKEFSGKGLEVLAIDDEESAKTVQDFLAKSPRACQIVLEKDTDLTQAFPHSGVPYYVMIDSDGNVVGNQRGAGGYAPLRRLVQKAGL